jgi:hypothetical protein
MQYFRDFLATAPPEPDAYDRAVGRLMQGDVLFSATRAFELIFQTDGNLVLYAIDDATLPADTTQGSYSRAIWATGTNGMGATACVMQTDGNLVLYTAEDRPVWAAGTNGHPGAFLRCQDDGNLVIYSDDSALWSSGTYARPQGGSMGSLKHLPGLSSGFSFQLNAYSPTKKRCAYQQYVLALRADKIVASIDNWPASGNNLVNDFKSVGSLPSASLPAGYQVQIQLQNDPETADVTGVTWTVTNDQGQEIVNHHQTLTSIGGVNSGDLAPITAFELDVVGPVNGEGAVLSSGSGVITYEAESDLAPMTATDLSMCTETTLVTQESANTFYGQLPMPAEPALTLTQSFEVTAAVPMLRTIHSTRPSTWVQVPPS